jgi:hypothetical protein
MEINDAADDLLIIAAGLGTEGSMQRVSDRDPVAGRLLRQKNEKYSF